MMEFGRLFSRRGLAGGAAALGLLAAGAVGAASFSSAAAEAPVSSPAVVGITQVAPGTATLFFDWGCDGSYSSTSITFNANGTFSTGDSNSGTWVRIGGTAAGNQAGMITFQFTGSSTTYSNVNTSSAATGIQSTFSGLNGCHYIVGSQALAGQQLNADGHNSAGK